MELMQCRGGGRRCGRVVALLLRLLGRLWTRLRPLCALGVACSEICCNCVTASLLFVARSTTALEKGVCCRRWTEGGQRGEGDEMLGGRRLGQTSSFF